MADATATRSLKVLVRDAALLTAAAALAGLAFNALRPDGLPLVAREAYRILVPCPETAGEVLAMAPGDPRLREPGTRLVDARAGVEFARARLLGALNVPYDFLDPTPAEAVARLAASGAARLVVYGDGSDPDSGRELARELSGRGLRNVFYVEGGAPALPLEPEGAP